jgi:prepilin-type N-terminal cleavage/methylation domain-containing protein
MIHFKNLNKSGFSFIEIIIAISIIGVVLTSLFNLQNTIFNISFSQHSKILRLFDIRNVFFDYTTQEKLIKGEIVNENFEDPDTKLTIQMQKPNEKSSIAKYENIYLIKSIGKWRAASRDNEESMVSLLFNVKEKKEK